MKKKNLESSQRKWQAREKNHSLPNKEKNNPNDSRFFIKNHRGQKEVAQYFSRSAREELCTHIFYMVNMTFWNEGGGQDILGEGGRTSSATDLSQKHSWKKSSKQKENDKRNLGTSGRKKDYGKKNHG